MDESYPSSVLIHYDQVRAHLVSLWRLLEEVGLALEAIETVAETTGEPVAIAGIARTAIERVEAGGNMVHSVSDYCRAADTAFQADNYGQSQPFTTAH